MIVARWVETKVKPGRTKEMVDLLKAQAQYGVVPPPHGVRIYWSGFFGDWGTVIYEADFESMAERDAYMKEAFGTPQMAEWIAKRVELVDGGGRGEVLSMEVLK